MKVVETLVDLRRERATLEAPFGLVPTMGFLHDGHLSLVRRAKGECASVGVSIYVNPTQFGRGEDIEAYPRDLERDLDLLKEEGVDLVWTPGDAELYPPGFSTWVTVEGLSDLLEGEMRPGHFRGVATIVAKLFNAFEPDRAYFGQKDAQQAVLIRRLASDLNFRTEVMICPTVREPDGLAMSSRNAYLTPPQREAAPVLFRALSAAAEAYENGERDASALGGIMRAELDTDPLAQTQYVSVADPDTLQELEGPVERALLSMAVQVGKARLIDNVLVGEMGDWGLKAED